MNKYNFELDLTSPNTMSIINSWITDGAEILEFGPANGRLTKHLSQERKCKVTIVEMDETAGKDAAQYAAHSYIGTEKGDINHFYWYNPPKQYDYIIFADVLEHLPNPQIVLKKCLDIISPKGAILVSIPNIAHNSVLIDLFNDNFDYSDTGLLDSTHIHFFTYRSFFKMIRELSLVIADQQPVYSRVGWNEIHNYYSDVPYLVERELRNRKSGTIYQYVVCLRKEAPGESTLSFDALIDLFTDQRDEEACCFVWRKGGQPEEFVRFSQVYCNDEKEQKALFYIDMSVEKVRFDPLKANGLLIIHNIKIKAEGQALQETSIADCNAACNWGNIFYFKNSDPQIEIDVRNFCAESIEYIELHWQILDSHLNERYKRIYDALLSGSEGMPKDGNFLFYNIEQQKRRVLEIKNAADAYAEHLEKDIETLKSEINNRQNTINEQSQYIQHLEHDIEILKGKQT